MNYTGSFLLIHIPALFPARLFSREEQERIPRFALHTSRQGIPNAPGFMFRASPPVMSFGIQKRRVPHIKLYARNTPLQYLDVIRGQNNNEDFLPLSVCYLQNVFGKGYTLQILCHVPLLRKQKKTSSAADTAFSLVLSITRAARNPADFSSLIRAFRPSDFFWNACLFCLYVCAALCYTMVQRCERSTLTGGANQLAAPQTHLKISQAHLKNRRGLLWISLF